LGPHGDIGRPGISLPTLAKKKIIGRIRHPLDSIMLSLSLEEKAKSKGQGGQGKPTICGMGKSHMDTDFVSLFLSVWPSRRLCVTD